MKHTVASGETRTATVPVAEDAAYDVTVTGPNGFEKTFRGVLHGRTAAPGTKSARAPSGKPAPATTGGSSATPMIAAVAAALVVLGAGAVVLLGRKRAARGPCVRPQSTWLRPYARSRRRAGSTTASPTRSAGGAGVMDRIR
ncbi:MULTISPECIES: LAETG motif-containing sortase-dependent surface protein [unclassified Streptomyces]|uniref:LAETG motif-containing sortase-dependent surface protein n=1 Tax=unclassified Streptomyces TaxID=2593676 RepID=UPI00382E60F7